LDNQLEKAQWEIAKNRPGETLISSETELFDLYKYISEQLDTVDNECTTC